MSRLDDSIAYLELMATCDPGVAEGVPKGIPAPEFEAQVVERFGHSPRQLRARLDPLRSAGLVMRLPARSGRPALVRITSQGIQARERVRSRQR